MLEGQTSLRSVHHAPSISHVRIRLTTYYSTYYLLPTTYYVSTVVSCSVSISETIRFTSSFVSRTARSFWAAYLSVASAPRVGR